MEYDFLLDGEIEPSINEKKYSENLVDLYAPYIIDNSEKSFSFEAEHFLLKKQEIIQPDKERSFEVNYPNFQDFVSGIFPTSLTINALQKKVKTTIIIDYNSKTFNEDLSFPYNVPDGYDRIFIK